MNEQRADAHGGCHARGDRPSEADTRQPHANFRQERSNEADIFPEEATERFSKGDYRRIKEYLEEPETGGVASDRDIIADVLGRRVDDPSYERLRFSLDYRLLKEKKDFEFVGIDSDRLWINANTTPVLPGANHSRRRASRATAGRSSWLPPSDRGRGRSGYPCRGR